MLSKACEELCDAECRLFNEEYNQFFVEGETKPRDIGEPFLLNNPTSQVGILLIHGLMAAPEEVREWADYLFSKGYTVYASRLAGHGTSSKDLSTRDYDAWMASVNRGQKILNSCCDKIVIAGFSTGAGLALNQALNKPDDFEAVISISAPLQFKGNLVRLVEPLHQWNRFFKLLPLTVFQKEYVTNHPDNPHINYKRCPVKSLVEVRSLMKTVGRNLHRLSIPSLVIQGKNDPKVDDRSGKNIFDRISKFEKQYVEIEYHLHGIIRGKIACTVFDEVEQFLHRLFEK